MASPFNMLKDLDLAAANQVWRIKICVIKIWSIIIGEEKFRRPNLELVVMDELKYKPTTHAFRVFFKRETQCRSLGDINFPNNIFHFVPNEMILSHDNHHSHLIDVIGLLTGKSDIIEFTKNGKKSIYMVIELDDMKSKGKIRCTLWEDFANKLVKHMEEQPSTEFIIILQFAKFNMFKGTMGISNTNYNSTLYINADLQEVKEFRQRFIMGNDKASNQLSQIASDVSMSLEQDLISHTPYKPISELKDTTEGRIFVTIGTVMSIDTRFGWWYKGCKMCFHSLKEDENSYYCQSCDIYPNIHISRYCIHLRVSDEMDSASFIIYDKEASKFLEISASELRLKQIAKGYNKDEFPSEINSFRGKKFLFKVSVKFDDINAFQPCKITVLKLTEDPTILNLFAAKYKLSDPNIPIENSELQSLHTYSTDNAKEISSQSCEIISLDVNDDFVTPKRGIIAGVMTKKLVDVFPETATTSTSKCRKLSHDSDCSSIKKHAD
ncbi:replication protein A 70 kDa DNA-binding subunit E-like [Arachis hypogaea]|uniref:Replication factor A C-terminal domain-containing protein n=1 Tax=Arachis hypogaea TaxID=3818 RepID=A0A444ZP56_ARAHY|nr:uncharacterized protein LOC112742837 [Arachis hypogaea]QHO07508.1 Replication protein A 70 kDa DNA-binding subunit B [Arachis hypogaea]RYR15914.1 hypothetical protein Ahy_B04g072868 [Arachis hypogaea]